MGLRLAVAPPASVTRGLAERKAGTPAGDVNPTIGNGGCPRQRAEVRRRECPAASPGELIDGDGIAAISYINGVISDGGRGRDRAGLVVAPDLFARGWVVSSQVTAAIAYK